MTIDDAITFFKQQPAQEKAKLLAELSFELTITARDAYGIQSDRVANPERLREFNEIQHRVAGFQTALLCGTPSYPDDVFARMILEHDDSSVRHTFEYVLAKAMNTFLPVQQKTLKTA